MKLILDISTILGGIAAAWFLWDRFTVLNRHVSIRSSETAKPYTWVVRIFMSLLFAGIGIFWIVGRSWWGWDNLAAVCFLGLIPGCIGGLLDSTRHGNELVNSILIFGGGLFTFGGFAVCLAGPQIETISTSFLTVIMVSGVLLSASLGDYVARTNIKFS